MHEGNKEKLRNCKENQISVWRVELRTMQRESQQQKPQAKHIEKNKPQTIKAKVQGYKGAHN
jgi:hypothetical protein